MRDYFTKGDSFTWVRDKDPYKKEMVLKLKILREISRASGRQALLVQDVGTGRKYFAKILFTDSFDQVYVEKESKVDLYSPFVIRIYGGMLDQEHRRFITLMDYIDCPDLSDLVSRQKIAGSGFRERMKVTHTIALKFLRGIDYYMSLYRQDPLVHRDLKPENVMASSDGSIVKIIDFDWVHLHESSVTVTERRQQKGTPGYADPAYWNSYVCDRGMDIYSAGLVLFFLYTGRHHFHGSEEINRYMVGDDYAYTLKEMPGISPGIREIISKMIARPENRYEDIRDVVKDFEECLKKDLALPDLPELFSDRAGEDVIRFSYRIGDITYRPYVRNYRFIPVIFGQKQERSRNGKASGHILSFYRVDGLMKVLITNENCQILSMGDREVLGEGDCFLYEGVKIEILKIRGGNYE